MTKRQQRIEAARRRLAAAGVLPAAIRLPDLPEIDGAVWQVDSCSIKVEGADGSEVWLRRSGRTTEITWQVGGRHGYDCATTARGVSDILRRVASCYYARRW